MPKPIGPVPALATQIKELEETFGAIPLAQLQGKDKLRIAEAVLGLERVRVRLLSNKAEQEGWPQIVDRDRRLHKLSGVRSELGASDVGMVPAQGNP